MVHEILGTISAVICGMVALVMFSSDFIWGCIFAMLGILLGVLTALLEEFN